MCQTAMRYDTGEEIGSIADIKRVAGSFEAITWQRDVKTEDAASLPEDACLCWVNIPNTLIDAGFKVWRGDFVPEYWCEPAPRPDLEGNDLNGRRVG